MTQLQHQLKVFKNRQPKTKATMALYTLDSLGGLDGKQVKMHFDEQEMKDFNKRLRQAYKSFLESNHNGY